MGLIYPWYIYLHEWCIFYGECRLMCFFLDALGIYNNLFTCMAKFDGKCK